MGASKSRMKKVAPVSVTEEAVSSGDVRRDESRWFGRSDPRVSVGRRARADCTSEFSAVDLAEEVDRILADCDNPDISLNRTSYKMPMFALHYRDVYGGSARDKNGINAPTSIQAGPPREPLNRASTESAAAAPGSAIGGGSSVALPVYDASEEDLMNTIEKEFGSQPQ